MKAYKQMQKYYTECRSHFNSTILGRRRLVSSESCMIADPFQKDCILMPLHTHPQKVLKLFLNYSQLQVAGDFGPKRQQQVGGRNLTADETPFSKTVGHFQWATSSSHWKKIWRNKFLKCAIVFCSNFWVMIFYPEMPPLVWRKRKKVDLPGKIQVVINFHQLETPYNQQSSSL